jgi:PucR C-terminal helix-turn-helix domain/GGDEF-like domain
MALIEQELPQARVARYSLREQVQEELGELVARGASRGALVAALEAALECRLSVLCSTDGEDGKELGIPIAPGTEVLGRLQSDILPALATPEIVECLEYGARIIGIELVRERVALETRWSLEADLLIELLEAGEEISDRLAQRARHAGFDLTCPWHVLVLETANGGTPPCPLVAVARRPAISGERSMSCVRAGRLVVAVCGEPGDAREAKLRDLHRVARGLGVTVSAGVSSAVTDFALGARQAEAALRLATCSTQAASMYHEDLGSLRFLLNAPNQLELVSLVRTQIGPLAQHDLERQGELLETLRVFLDEGGNRRRAAERCHVHQSTIKYRLRRIRELLGCDLGDADVRFDLMLAIKVLELLRAVDADPTASPSLHSA